MLTGCISIVHPPESSYNGLYLQIYETGGGFVAQENTNSYEECAFYAANLPKWTRGKWTMFCTKENNPNVNHKATIKYSGGSIHDVLFTSNDACGRYLIENTKSGDIQVVNFCKPFKP